MPFLTAAKPSRKCLAKGCLNKAHSRGLCYSHYQRAHTQVREGRTSWSELEQRGEAKAAAYTRNHWSRSK